MTKHVAGLLPDFYEQVGGGDGVPAIGNTGPTDPILGNTPSDASADDAALEAHIAQVTGLPIQRTEVQSDDQAATGADGDAADGAAGAGADSGAGGGQADGGDAGGDQGQGTGTAGAGSGDAGGDSGQGEAGAVIGDQGAQQEKPPAEEKPVETPAIKPEDYALEVEDAAGTKYTINSIDDLPDDFTPKSNKQALQILDDLRELQTKRKADEEQVAVAAAEKQRNDAQAEVQKGWMTEIEALQADGRIDKPKIKEGQPGFLEDPAIKRMDEVFTFMVNENKSRLAKGIAPIRSFTDALTHLELKEARAAKVTADRASADVAKRKAGLLSGAGGAGNGSGVADQPYRAGQAQDIFDVINR
jgi:hypothetical protein